MVIAASDDKQTPGRKANAATRPDKEVDTAVSPERYPAIDKHDAVQPPPNPRPRQGAGDGGPKADGGRTRTTPADR